MDLTPEKAWQQSFLKRLAETGNVSEACRKAKITRQNAYAARKTDAIFDAAWDEALEISTEALELEARRRAEKGVLDPIYQQGVKVGSIRKYSDVLLIFLLKAHKPEKYRDNQRIEHTGKDGGPIDHKIDHAINGDTATTIFDILAAAGALATVADDAQDDGVYSAQPDT